MMNSLEKMQDEKWRKVWRGIHLPPSSFPTRIIGDEIGTQKMEQHDIEIDIDIDDEPTEELLSERRPSSSKEYTPDHGMMEQQQVALPELQVMDMMQDDDDGIRGDYGAAVMEESTVIVAPPETPEVSIIEEQSCSSGNNNNNPSSKIIITGHDEIMEKGIMEEGSSVGVIPTSMPEVVPIMEHYEPEEETIIPNEKGAKEETILELSISDDDGAKALPDLPMDQSRGDGHGHASIEQQQSGFVVVVVPKQASSVHDLPTMEQQQQQQQSCDSKQSDYLPQGHDDDDDDDGVEQDGLEEEEETTTIPKALPDSPMTSGEHEPTIEERVEEEAEEEEKNSIQEGLPDLPTEHETIIIIEPPTLIPMEHNKIDNEVEEEGSPPKPLPGVLTIMEPSSSSSSEEPTASLMMMVVEHDGNEHVNELAALPTEESANADANANVIAIVPALPVVEQGGDDGDDDPSLKLLLIPMENDEIGKGMSEKSEKEDDHDDEPMLLTSMGHGGIEKGVNDDEIIVKKKPALPVERPLIISMEQNEMKEPGAAEESIMEEWHGLPDEGLIILPTTKYQEAKMEGGVSSEELHSSDHHGPSSSVIPTTDDHGDHGDWVKKRVAQEEEEEEGDDDLETTSSLLLPELLLPMGQSSSSHSRNEPPPILLPLEHHHGDDAEQHHIQQQQDHPHHHYHRLSDDEYLGDPDDPTIDDNEHHHQLTTPSTSNNALPNAENKARPVSVDGEATSSHVTVPDMSTVVDLEHLALSTNQENPIPNNEALELPEEPANGLRFDAAAEEHVDTTDFVNADGVVPEATQELVTDGNKEHNDGNGNDDVSTIGPKIIAAAGDENNGSSSSSYHHSGPSVPLYPLLLTISFHYVLKRLLVKRAGNNQTKERTLLAQSAKNSKSQNQFVVSKEDLEKQIRLLRFNLEKTKAITSRLEKEHGEAIVKSNGFVESIVTLQGDNERLSADLESFKSKNSHLVSQLGGATTKLNAIAPEHKLLTAQLAKAEEDADVLWKALETERLTFSQREAALVKEVHALDGRVQEEKQKSLGHAYDQSVRIARLESFRSNARLELEEKRMSLSTLTTDLAKAKKDATEALTALEEERSKSLDQCDASRAEKDRSVEAQLTGQEGTTNDQSAIIATLEKRIATLALTALEEERSKSLDQCDASRAEKDRSVEAQLTGQEGKTNDQSAIIATLEKRIATLALTALEEERSKLLLDQCDTSRAEKDRSVEAQLTGQEEKINDQSAIIATLEKRIATLALTALEEEKSKLDDQCNTSRAEKDWSVEAQLTGQQGNTNDQSAIIATLEKRIAATEADRDDVLLKLERERLALSNSKTDQEELTSILNKARADAARLAIEKENAVFKSNESENRLIKLQGMNTSLSADLDASKSKINNLQSHIESEQRGFLRDLKHVTGEKEKVSCELSDVKTKFKDAMTDNEAKIKRKMDEAIAMNETITLANAKIAQFDSSDFTSMQERDELVSKAKKTTLKLPTADVKPNALEDSFAKLLRLNKTLSTDLDASKSKIRNLESQIKGATDKYNIMIEPEHKEVSPKLKLVMGEEEKIPSELCNVEAKFEDTVTDNETSIQQKNDEAKALKEMITLTNAKIAQFEAQVSTLMRERDELATRVDVATLNLSEADAKSSDLEESIFKLQAKNERMSADIDLSESKINDLHSQKKVATSNYNAINSEHKKCIDELERVKGEKEKVSSELTDVKAKFEDAVADLEVIIKHRTDEASRLQETIRSVNAKIAQFEEQVSTLTQERNDLATKIEETTLDFSEADAKSSDLEDSVLKLHDKNERLSADLSFSRSKIIDLESQIGDATIKYNTIDSEHKNFVNELKRVKGEKETILCELTGVKAKFEGAVADNEASIKQKSDEANALKGMITSANAKIAQFEEQVSTLMQERDEIACVEMEKEEMVGELNMLQDNIADLQVKNESLSAALGHLKSQMVEVSAKSKNDMANLEALVKEKADEICALNKVIASMYDQITRLHEAKVDLAKAKESVETKGEEAVAKLNVLEETIAKLQIETKMLSTNLVASESKNHNLTSQREEATIKFQRAIIDLETSLQNKADKADALNDSIALSEAKVEQLAVQVSTLAQDRDTLISKVEKATLDLTRANEDANVSSKAFDAERLSLIQTKDALTKQVDKLEECLQNECEQNQLTLSALTAKHAETVCSLEKCLKDEKEKCRKIAEDEATIVAQLEQRIASAESDQNETLQQCEQNQLALAKATKDANVASEAFEEDKLHFMQRDASYIEQIRSLEECLETRRKDQAAIVAKFEEQTAITESDRDDSRRECEQKQLVLSALSESLDEAKENAFNMSNVLEEERFSFQQQVCGLKDRLEKAENSAKENAQIASEAVEEERLGFQQQVCSLEEQLEELKLDSVKKTKEQLAIIVSFEEQVLIAESDRDDARLGLQEERNALSTLTSSFAKAEEDAKITSKAVEKERLSFQQQVCDLEEELREMKEEEVKRTKDQLVKLSNLEERVFLAESDRDNVRLELKEESCALSALSNSLAKAEEDAKITSNAAADERLSFKQQVCRLEEHIEELKQESAKKTEDQLAIIARLEELVTVVESDRDNSRLELLKKQAALSSLTTRLAKAEVDAKVAKAEEEEILSFQQQVCSLEDQLKDVKQESAKKTEDQCATIARLEELVTVVESDRDNSRLELLKKQAALSSLTTRLAKAEVDAKVAKAEEDERLSFQQQVCNLEDQLKDVKQESAKKTKDQWAIIAKLREQVAHTQSDRNESRLALEEERVTLSLMRTDAKISTKASEEERLIYCQQEAALVKQISHLHQCLDKENHNVVEALKYHSTIAELERRIHDAESDRDNARLECENERSALFAIATDLAKAEKYANVASKAFKRERLHLNQRDSLRVEQIRCLAKQLGEEEDEGLIIAKEQVANLEDRIAVAESERDAALKQCELAESDRDASRIRCKDARLQCEEKRASLFAAMDDLAKEEACVASEVCEGGAADGNKADSVSTPPLVDLVDDELSMLLK